MIIQHILESRSETSTIAMVNVKMDLIISKLIDYADQLPLSQQAISIKIKLCQLLQTVSYDFVKAYTYVHTHTHTHIHTHTHTHTHIRIYNSYCYCIHYNHLHTDDGL